MSIDILMTATAVLVSIIASVVTAIIQTRLNRTHIKFKDLHVEYLEKVNKDNTGIVSEKEIDILLETLRKTYSKMLENDKEDSGDVCITLCKYNKENQNLQVIYRLPQEPEVKPILFEYSMQGKNSLANLYINSNSEIDKVFHYRSKKNLNRWGSFLAYVLKKQNNVMGILCISSWQRVNERYGYENIKMLIEPIEEFLVSYIQDKKDAEP